MRSLTSSTASASPTGSPALPHGLDTQVGQRGESLSAGERQLVALLRSALADPDFLVLDEATSAVDPQTELRATRALGPPARRAHERHDRAPSLDRRERRPGPGVRRRPPRRGRHARRAGRRRRRLLAAARELGRPVVACPSRPLRSPETMVGVSSLDPAVAARLKRDAERPRDRRRPGRRQPRRTHGRLDGRRGAAPHPDHGPRHVLEPQPPGLLGQGRDVRATSRRCARCGSTATATPCSCSSTSTGRPATPATRTCFDADRLL